MPVLSLAFKSLRNRKLTFFLTLFSIAISVMLLLGVQMVKNEAKNSFMQSVSGTDLIIGPRSSSVELLLYSVFHIGTPSNVMQLETYEHISKMQGVAWSVPVSMGDSHHGFTVMATTDDFYKHLSYANGQKLKLGKGEIGDDMFDVVLGADVAKKLNYNIGDKLVMSHGSGEVSFVHHDTMPFHVSGILEPTHTPMDQTLVISLEGMEAMHFDYEIGEHSEHAQVHHSEHKDEHDSEHEAHSEQDHEASLKVLRMRVDTLHDEHHSEKDHTATRMAKEMQLFPETISAVFVGLESKRTILGIQRSINEYKGEALSAIIPALALQELWEFFSVAEVALGIVASFVVLVGLLGMLSIILMSLNERRREMAILRSVGARPIHIFGLIVGEAAFVSALGIILGVILLYVVMFLLQAPLASFYGFYLEIHWLNTYDLLLLALIEGSAILIGFIPGYLIYRHSLRDGMNIKF